MTELLLKNKKLLNEDLITEFNYNNTIFENQISDLFITFKKFYKTKDISSEDKEVINKFIKDNKGNLEKYKDIINDFISLIEYLNYNKKDKQDKGKTLVYDIVKNMNIDNLSKDFLTIFDEKKKLTVNKLSELFNYYLQLIFEDIKEEIKNYQEKREIETEEENQLDIRSIKRLNEYYQKKMILISKEDLEKAIRLFITLVLFREKDKENKVKLNRKNIINYLKSPDLWNDKIYQDQQFKENLDELKSCDIPINHILWLYNYIVIKENENQKEYEKQLDNINN